MRFAVARNRLLNHLTPKSHCCQQQLSRHQPQEAKRQRLGGPRRARGKCSGNTRVVGRRISKRRRNRRSGHRCLLTTSPCSGCAASPARPLPAPEEPPSYPAIGRAAPPALSRHSLSSQSFVSRHSWHLPSSSCVEGVPVPRRVGGE